jgi:RNA polymerase sigma-70 factor (ECF subfamily)
MIRGMQHTSPPHAPDDSALIARLHGRDQGAFAALYSRHSAPVFNLASYILRNRTLAEEVTQEVFILLWREPGKWRPGGGPFASWLLTVTRYMAIDRLRLELRHTARQARSLDEVAEELADIDNAPAAEDVYRLNALLAELPPDQKHVLYFAFFQGMTHEEIAHKLQIPAGTVKSRLRLALGKLRARWREQLLEEQRE